MRRYETTFILSPELEETELEKNISRYSNIITAGGGTIEKEDRWGMRRLAYQIKKKSQGYYVQLVHESGPDIPRELERQFILNEDCLRYLTVLARKPIPEAEEKPSIGGFSTPNIEEIVALSPDLILATVMHETEVIPQLESYGLTVVATNPETIDEVIEAIALIGKVTGTKKEADSLIADMRDRIKAVIDKTEGIAEKDKPKALFIVWHDPLMAAGSGTLHHELMQTAGGINVAGDLDSYADISLEAVIVANPGVMIAGIGMGTGEDLPLQFLMSDTRLENTDARKNGRIYPIDQDIVGRPGPRIVDALEQFAEFIHPELFEGK